MSGPTVHWYVRITLIGATILLSVNMVMITVVLDDDCISFGQAISWSSALAFISTSSLLQLRVWAVFHSSVIIQAIFALLWVVVIIGSFSIGFSNRVFYFGLQSIGCIADPNKLFVILVSALVMGYDTLISFALSTRLLMNSTEETWIGRLRMFVSKSGMPRISRLLLQTEQLSYA